MAISDVKLREYSRRLILSRMRLLSSNGFYGLLLMHARFAVDEKEETAATDGNKIYFSPAFLDEISDKELDFVMMHEIMHIALQHPFRYGERDSLLFNIACDVVVNSNILKSCGMDERSITLKKYGVSMHLAPDGNEGYEYTAEQVYNMLLKRREGRSANNKRMQTLDSHGRWTEDPASAEEWQSRTANAAEAINMRGRSAGAIPAGAERLLKELKNPVTDWRTILNDFIQDDVTDYSFTPPDRRFDGPFFLPDFNERDENIGNVLFMIDTSASMTDDMVTAAYSEVYGAIEQFNGRLKGLLGFFDAAVVPPQKFMGADEFKVIKPKGGGGTDFFAVFDYISKKLSDDPPSYIIILTDGYAPFPAEHTANSVPVLWLIVDSNVTPPWGKTARIKLNG